jgi:hypothetical protein
MSDQCEGGCGSTGEFKAGQRPRGESGNGRNLVLAVWALALFAAFLFGSTIANIVTVRQTYEGTKRQTEAIRALNSSMLEVRKSIADLSGLFQEGQEMEHGVENGSPFQRSFLGDEKV